jgi:hypothetical protein
MAVAALTMERVSPVASRRKLLVMKACCSDLRRYSLDLSAQCYDELFVVNVRNLLDVTTKRFGVHPRPDV